jgi:hypothetical protein
LEDGKKRILWNMDLADALHTALAFLLFFGEFAFARNISGVALGERGPPRPQSSVGNQHHGTFLRMAATVSRAITRLPIVPRSGTSIIWREISFRRRVTCLWRIAISLIIPDH